MVSAVVLLLILNSVLLVRDIEKKRELVTLRQNLYDSGIRLRVLEAEFVFGSTFIPKFTTYDLMNNKEASLPYLGTHKLLMFFFKPNDCRTCLHALKFLYDELSDGLPVVGIAQTDTPDSVHSVIQEYGYDFPVFVIKEASFNLADSPYGVFVDEYKNILNLSKVNPSIVPILDYTEQLKIIIERRQ